MIKYTIEGIVEIFEITKMYNIKITHNPTTHISKVEIVLRGSEECQQKKCFHYDGIL